MSIERTLVIGIGSPHGDDQAGWLAADRLAAGTKNLDHVAIRRAASPMDLFNWLEEVDRLVICDACQGMRRVGEVRRWSWPTSEIPAAGWSGTHDFSLPAVLALAQRLGHLPRQVVVWAVEGAIRDANETPSADVVAAIPVLVDRIRCELTGEAPWQDKRCTNSH